MMCEKTITSLSYELLMKLLDMSKAFDNVRRKLQFLNDLKQILDADEYHMMSILILDVGLKARVGNC